MFINFSDIPGHQNLFLDYLYEPENTQKYYSKNYADTNSYSGHFEELINIERPHKNLLSDIIVKQYGNLKYSKQTETNIKNIKKQNTVAVITGQQLGIFGGPLYTFYKTTTVIKLANSLKEKYPDYNFIPVFWMEGEDHDFEEISYINIPSNNNDIIKIVYSDSEEEDKNRGSVAKLVFENSITNTIEELKSALFETEFSKDVFELIEKCYQPGRTIKDSFQQLMFELFDEQGLILFDPTDLEIKKLLSPIFRKEIEGFREHTSKSIAISADLEESFHAQVKVRPINLFVSDETGRFVLEPVEEEFRLRGKRKKFTKEEILTHLEEHPENFGPNVLLRPICQDHLFPTGFYVGGPSEVSYFAQVDPLYQFFNIPEPFVYPRASATLLEKNIQKVLDKYNLDIVDLFIEEKLLNNRIINDSAEMNLAEIFDKSSSEIELVLDGLQEKLFGIDQNLVDVTQKSKQRIFQTLDQIKNKAEKAQTAKYDVTLRQLNRARNILYPNGALQERSISFIYFANKYGLDLFKWIGNELSINKFEHQVIDI